MFASQIYVSPPIFIVLFLTLNIEVQVDFYNVNIPFLFSKLLKGEIVNTNVQPFTWNNFMNFM